MAVTRAVVDEVKTEYSEDDLPLDPDLASNRKPIVCKGL
jgi:hypothetical protein